MTYVKQTYKKGALKDVENSLDNTKMPKDFSMIKAIRDEKIYKSNVQVRDKKAREYIEKDLKKGNSKLAVPGQLMTFDYFEPKTKEDLEYYDAKPCTLFFGIQQTDEGDRVIGFNIHYYPPRMRYKIMDRVFELYKSSYKSHWDSFYKKPIENFDWHIFVTLLQEAKLDFGIRKYIPNLMANVTPIPTKAWSKVVFTEGYFKKKTRQMILNYWKQKKIDKMFGVQSKKHARKTQRKLNTKRK